MGSDIFGALFASVSGLDAQSTNLSIIANNVANSNTIGYKATQSEFETLVSGTGTNSNFASGGVTADNQQLVDQQGLLQSTNSPTDIAIQGSGLFVVNSNSASTGEVLYTRAGSFTQDSSGNFVNTAGYYLQAWPLDSNGLLPGAPGNTTDTTSSANLSSLVTVNVENVAGKASATTGVSLSANLNASQAPYPGAGLTTDIDSLDTTNAGIAADTVIVPTSAGNPTPDKLTQGDQLSITTQFDPTGFTYTYGGVTYSRSVTSTLVDGSSATNLQSAADLGTADAITFDAATPTSMTINGIDPTTAGIQVGTVVNLSGTSGNGLNVNNITTLDGNYYVTAIDTVDNTITVAIPSGTTPPSTMSLSAANFTSAGGGSTTIDVAGATIPSGMTTGDYVTFSDMPTVDSVLGSALDGTFQISAVNSVAGTFTINGVPADGGGGAANVAANANTGMFDTDGDLTAATAKVTSRLFTGNILDADNATSALITTPSDYTTAAQSFTINTTSDGTATFSYTSATPDASLGQFNTLNSLAAAINDSPGLTARVVDGQLYVAAVNGNDAITFANGSATGSNTSPPLGGINWVGELGLANVAASTNRFSTLQGLADLVNNSTNVLTATVNNPLGAASVKINVNNPLDKITFTDGSTNPPHTNTGSLLGELGLSTSLNSGIFSQGVNPPTAGPFGPSYDAAVSATNMASGNITPQFSRSITVYDSLGAAHNLNVGFINTGTNSWAVEIYAQPSSDILETDPALVDGQVAVGSITFNGDGTLQSVSAGLSSAIPIDWTDGSTPSSITMNWGTAGAIGTGKTDGMSQFSSPFSVNFVNQNGSAVGALTGVSIGTTGLITASFSNGQTQNLFQIPLASFTDPDQLQSISGNVFSQSATSGQVNLQQIGASSVGTITSSSLEESNVQLADQLTNMIVAQQAYQANTKVISTADNLLTSLDQIFQ